MASKNISSLPSDILVVALRRLEVKCLVRCTSVCKSWHHIIKSSYCAKAHLSYQKTSSDAKKYILHQDSNSGTLLTDIKPVIDGTKHSRLFYGPELFEKDIYINEGCKVRIHGISDGLLCLSSDDGISDRGYCVGDNLYLWNPICRKAKKLPELKITEKDDGLIRKGGVSFGYYHNDYKVIVVSCDVDRRYIVSVYSLTSNCWNVIHTNSFYEHNIEESEGFCIMHPTRFVDGIAYMIIDIYRRTALSYRIPILFLPLTVCFSLREETIEQFKCPEEFVKYRTQYTMEEYGETIAVMGCDNYSGTLNKWILSRDKALWEKKQVMKLNICYSNPVGFLYKDIYMVKTVFTLPDAESISFYLYDLVSGEVTEYYSAEDNPDHRCKIDSDRVESLLLLNEESVDPFVHTEIESSSSSMLFTLHNAIIKNGRKRKR